MTPRTFGKYLLDREIARGGMARVHLARLRGLGGFEKTLVLKEIDPRLASDPRFVTLFVEEARPQPIRLFSRGPSCSAPEVSRAT
ncbi:MAG: hypothetical protein K1X94_06460 [Sandaracinaceae bacterium]|nr:hypothetical protein [Sandaracinaceae bacterium]